MKPSVGLPIFFGAVAVTAVLVPAAILTNTTWFPAFMEGGKAKVTVTQPVPAVILPEVKM